MVDSQRVVKLGEVLGKSGYIRGPFGSALRRNDRTFRFFIDEEKHKVLSRFTVKPNDLIISCSGTLGKVSIIQEEDPKGIISQALLLLRPNINVILPKYLYYFFSSPMGFHSLVSVSSGSVQVNLAKRSDIENITFNLPSIPEQKSIIDLLSALDDKIELNRRMNRTLESMARAVFREWFVESEDVGRWKESSLEEIYGKKSDCVLTGPFGSHLHAHDYREEGTPLILVKHVIDGHIIEDRLPMVGAHKLSDMKRYILDVGDIVFTRVGAVGRSAYVRPRNKGWIFSGQTLRVRVPDKTKLNPRYLSQIYREPYFIEMVEQQALGTTRPSLNTSILLKFKFILPPIELQNKFGEFSEAIDKKVQINLDESRTLVNLRDTLLPKLMRGEVRVKG
jgi:type I restriction enzyme S subunit